MAIREPSLHDELKARGFTHRPAYDQGTSLDHDVIDGDGVVIFTGDAQRVWDWLRASSGQTKC